MQHGQPVPPQRRQQDFPYNTVPPNMRSSPYMGYHPHMNGNIPQSFAPHAYPQWYPPYGHIQQMPQRPYQPHPYSPMIVSSYPHSQPVMAPTHLPPHSMPMQQRIPTPLQPTMSPSIPISSLHPEMHEHPAVLPQPVQVYPVASPSPRWEPKSSLPPKPDFTAPVSSHNKSYLNHTRMLTNKQYSFLGCLSPSSLSRLESHADVARAV
jgi:ubiquitin carboxyl-terminal hydrolase 10